MGRLRILPLFVLIIAILLLAMGFMIVKTYEEKIAPPPPTIIQTQSPPVQHPKLTWIKIDPIGDKVVGDTFTVTSTTNLSDGEDIHVELTKVQWHSHQKGSKRVESGGSSDTVKVSLGSNGTNTFSFTVNTTGWDPEEYFVSAWCESCNEVAIGDITRNETIINLTPKIAP